VLERWQSSDPQSYEVALESSITYAIIREFEKAEIQMRKAIAIAPDLPDAFNAGAWNYLQWDGTTERARQLLATAPSAESSRIKRSFVELDLYDRKPEAALARLEDVSVDVFLSPYWYIPKGLLECTALSQMGERKRAEAACASVVEPLEREIETRPHDYRLHIALGHTYAFLGRSEEALLAGEHAVELMPISKDVLDGGDQSIELAKIYTRAGEHEEAVNLIEELLSIPCRLSVGLLRLDPVWDPLRDHPRFQALLEEYDTN
jgi:tetratricopeptide (TPR) repeat protein